MRSNQNVEAARLAGFLAVVVLHANAFGLFSRENEAVGWALDEACRFAVPVFFLISGYFWQNVITDVPKFLIILFRKIYIPFIFWCIFYIILDYTQALYPSSVNRDWQKYLTAPWTGSVAFHLWFLPALFVGTLIGIVLIKYAGLYKALAVALALYLIGVMLGTYSRPFEIVVPLGVYRNGIFFAPIFLVGGYALSQWMKFPAGGTFLACIFGGLLLHGLEGYFVYGLYPHGHDISLGTLPFSVGVFGFFLTLRTVGKVIPSWGKEVFGAYLVHVLVFRVIIEYSSVNLSLSGAILISVMVFIISIGISRLAKINRYTRMLMP